MTSSDTVVRFLDREVAEPDRELVGTTWHVDGFADGDDPESTAMSSSTETLRRCCSVRTVWSRAATAATASGSR